MDRHKKMEGFMIATMSGISRVPQDIEDTPSSAQFTRTASKSLGCQRCGGMLVDEHCMDIGEEGSGHRFWGMRCVQCGDVIDETILRNRCSSIETLEKLRSRTRSRAIIQAMRYATVYSTST
jgi:hypothetical protein